MKIPLRAAQLTGFAEQATQERSLFFFTPIRNEQGRLINLQLFQGGQWAVGADIPESYLSDWVVPKVEAYLSRLWPALEQGISCWLDCQLTPQTSGKLTITPIQNGYLVELQSNDASPPAQLASDPFLSLMQDQIQKEQHRRVTDSMLQVVARQVPCQQIIYYTFTTNDPLALVQYQLVKGESNGPVCIPSVSMDYLRGGKPIIDQQIEAHTPGLATALSLYQLGYRSFMLLPLLANNQLLGALLVMDASAHFFTASYQSLLSKCAHSLSESLFAETERRLPILLDEMNQLLDAVVFNTPVALALFRPVWQQDQITDFTYLLTNPANAAITGRSIAQMAAQTLRTLFPQTTREGLFERLVKVAQTGISQQYQALAQHDGLSHWGQFTLSKVGENVLFTVMDISALKQNQALLNHQNAQLEEQILAHSRQINKLSVLQNAILKHDGQAIISTSIDGMIQTANQACEKLLDYSVQELLGLYVQVKPDRVANSLPVISFHPTKQANGTTDILQQALNGEHYSNMESVVITKTGTTIPILLSAISLHDEDGVVIGYLGVASNISALKAVQGRLRQKNRELSTFFENALDMHCISDSRGNISKVNKAFQTALGYSAAELRAIPFLQLIHPDEQKFVYQQLLQPILQQPVRKQINQMRCKDGTYRIIEWNAIGIDGVVYGSAHDITQQQESEIQLRNLNQRLQLATQSVGQGVWEIDYERNCLLWDDRLWEIHGLESGQADWSFQKYLTLVHPKDLPAFLDRVQSDTQKDTLWNQTRIVRPDGAIRYTETNGILMRNQQGKPVRAIGVMWDVTERKLAEEALRESEQRFREIAENVDEVFWIHSADPFRLLYINPAYERIWNRSVQSIYDDTTTFMEGIVAEDRPAVQALFGDYLAGKEGQLDYRLEQADGSIRWLSVRTFIVRDGAGQITRHLGIVNDITGQKEKELVLLESLQREQELNQLKSQFVSTASHEFRTPLTTIQSSVDLITMYLNLPPVTARASIEHHVAVIQKEIEKFDTLLSDLLTIGKIEAGKIAFTPRWVDLLALINELIALHFRGHLFDDRSVVLLVEGTPRRVYLDDKLMSHVLVNLLSNAFKFSSDTSPCLRVVFNHSNLMLAVVDTGIGIPSEELSTLFQAFFRASNTAGIQGTGLGLVIARQFVELHRGQLSVESEENKGTTFTIRLPAEPEVQSTARDDTQVTSG
ncbi:PAS domain S-box protein [Spirosoma radiotolerans]|uniref:PAS domain S-box protein n=1 Tax=Spirosoma radiotolerans TaxID=1379870 RepID=UPI000695C620|nr:PAS domain S-box protein [Spirosoma radiotolerans]